MQCYSGSELGDPLTRERVGLASRKRTSDFSPSSSGKLCRPNLGRRFEHRASTISTRSTRWRSKEWLILPWALSRSKSSEFPTNHRRPAIPSSRHRRGSNKQRRTMSKGELLVIPSSENFPALFG